MNPNTDVAPDPEIDIDQLTREGSSPAQEATKIATLSSSFMTDEQRSYLLTMMATSLGLRRSSFPSIPTLSSVIQHNDDLSDPMASHGSVGPRTEPSGELVEAIMFANAFAQVYHMKHKQGHRDVLGGTNMLIDRIDKETPPPEQPHDDPIPLAMCYEEVLIPFVLPHHRNKRHVFQ